MSPVATTLAGPTDITDVVECAALALGRSTDDLAGWSIEPVDYEYDSPTTAGLYRIGGEGRSVFLKIVQSFRRWPLFQVLSEEWLDLLPVDEAWRYEADVYADGLTDALPEGLRLCQVYGIADLGDDRLVLALEDIRTSSSPWDRRRFERAARLLGRLNARLTRTDALPPVAFRVPGCVTNLYYLGRVVPAALPVLAADATWRHPLLAELADRRLRADLDELARRLPDLLQDLATRPQTLNHGDASPQNLLVPADDPDTFVVIDWTGGGLTAVGDDLSQLLVGLAHDGDLAVEELPALRDAIASAYTAGLDAEGLLVEEADVRAGMDGGLVVRSAFTSLPLERLGEPVTDELVEVFKPRLALTRYLVDLGLATSLTTR